MERGWKCNVASFLVLFLLLSSCTKVEKTTRKFMKEGRWYFTDLMTDGASVNNLAKWDIYTCDEGAEYCTGLWTHSNGTTAEFYWKFNKYSGDLEFLLSPDLKYDTNKASLQCNNLAGEYIVINSTSNEFELQSDQTKGYPGVQVYIKMTTE